MANLETMPASQLAAFLSANPHIDFPDHDFLSKGGNESLDWMDLDPENRVEALRAYQRLARVGASSGDSEKLIQAGLHSAHHIARMPQKRFVERVAGAAGIPTAQAEQIYRRAVGMQNKSHQAWASIRGTVASPLFRGRRFASVGASLAASFEKLPSYQEMFGSLDYCGCEECRSIFGPAAYLVDLLRIIEVYVAEPNKGSIPAGLGFAERRPDIGNIALTCDATETLVPYLQVVNERLADCAMTSLGLAAPADVIKAIATNQVFPQILPFNVPLNQIQILLDQAGAPYGRILQAMQIDPTVVAARTMAVSPDSQAILTTVLSTDAAVAPYFNVAAADLKDLSVPAVFLSKTNQDFSQFGDLIQQDLSPDEVKAKLQVNFFINGKLGGAVVALQQDSSKAWVIANLSALALDAINRQMRLSAILGWTHAQTDWALRAAAAGGTPVVTMDALLQIQAMSVAVADYGLTFLQAAALFGPIKTYGLGDGQLASQFDELFNTQALVSKAGIYRPSGNTLNPLYATTPLPWSPGDSSDANMEAINRVLPGLSLSLTDATILGTALFGQTARPLTVDSLSSLYRHGLMMNCLQLTMPRYLSLLDLYGIDPKSPFDAAGLSKLKAIISFLSASGASVELLDYVVNGTLSPYVALAYQPASVPGWQSALIAQLGNMATSATVDQVTAQMGVLFGVHDIMSVRTMAVSAVKPPVGGLTWDALFLATDDKGVPLYTPYVETVLAWCARWLTLQQYLGLSGPLMDNVAAWPGAYGLPPTFDTVSFEAIEMVADVQALGRRFGDTQNDLLFYIDDIGRGVAVDDALAALERTTGWPSQQISTLLKGPLGKVSPLATSLDALSQVFDLITALGADPGLLGRIASLANATATASWDEYLAVVTGILATVQNRYGAAWSPIALQVLGKTEVAERDALLALVLSELNAVYPDITTARHVFEFLLIDVEMGPETQISVLKEALNASQLYLQRCRLGLERGVDEFDIPPVWWEWMMNYRVWEANRQIFVYPENYLVPDLRKTTTPPFQQLEQNLLQSEVTASYVEQTYESYMQSFLEAARISPVETYRCIIDDPQQGLVGCTYLFGAGNTDPVNFYWCQQTDGMPWTSWTKIDLTINAKTITPVYAFGRLFVFWVEIAKGSGTAIQTTAQDGSFSTDSINYKATIYYSFLNSQDKWVQAQTLASEDVVYYGASGSLNVLLSQDPLFAGLFDFTDMMWKRVAVLHVKAAGFLQPSESQTTEKICILLGPILNTTAGTVDPTSPPAQNDGNANAFYDALRHAADDQNQRLLNQQSGNLSLRRALVLDGLLQDSVLIHRSEFLLFDGYVEPVPLNQVSAVFASAEESVLLVSAPAIISQNMLLDPNDAVINQDKAQTVTPASFVTPSIPAALAQNIFNLLAAKNIIVGGKVDPTALIANDLVDTLASVIAVGTFNVSQVLDVQKALYASTAGAPLFSALSPVDSSVRTVKNQPGWFVLQNGGESFLLQPCQTAAAGMTPVFSPIDEGISVSWPALSDASFVVSAGSTAITPAMSQLAMTALSSYALLDNGLLVPGTSFTAFKMVVQNAIPSSDGQRICYNIATNAPIVDAQIFARLLQLDPNSSTQVYTSLQGYQIIDPSGRVSADLLTPGTVRQAINNNILQNQITPYQSPAIYRVLNEAASAVALAYHNKGDASGFANPAGFSFTVTRLSTGAVRKLDQALFAGSLPALLSTGMQGYPINPSLPFSRLEPSATSIVTPAALDGTQVDFDGLYGQYFWEVFFHVPRLVAYMLQSNQKFQDALGWIQYVFNPTVAECFVTAKTFVDKTGNAINTATAAAVVTALQGHTIGTVPSPVVSADGRVNPQLVPSTDLSFLAAQPSVLDATQVLMVQAILLNYQLSAPTAYFWQFFPFRHHTLSSLQDQLSDGKAIAVYNSDPFDPFAIARLRIGAFEKAVVMQYIDALIGWGDMLFTEDSWESITAASLLYVYASDLLGPRPVEVGDCPGAATAATFNDIKAAYSGTTGGIPQFLIDLEHIVPVGQGPTTPIVSHAFNDLNVYFCVPENTQLMSYWDTIDDRLYKIEHSMNIQGQTRVLALFQPPINPLDLVKAAAAGNNVQAASQAGQPPSMLPYRYAQAGAFARQLTDSIISFGASLLGALEKRDAEGLGLLQTSQAGQILQMMLQMKQTHIDEVQQTIEGMKQSLASAVRRHSYYSDLADNPISSGERHSLEAGDAAFAFNILAAALNTASAIGYAIPQAGSPFAMTYGGIQVGSMVQASAGAAQVGGQISEFVAQRTLTMAGYKRRQEEWAVQRDMAGFDVDQITQNIAAAQSQLSQAEQDLAATRRQISQSETIQTYLTSKFSNQRLYGWMVARLSAIYFQSYQIALAAARLAEQAYQVETDSDRSFVSFDYWNSLNQGLLAGEGLRAALDQMDSSYRAGNSRRYEITKVISLALHSPDQLLALKTTGKCSFSLKEVDYDYDYPGQYARKLATISVSIPAIIGPYQTVKAVLRQDSNQIVSSPSIAAVKYLLGMGSQPPATGLRSNWLPNQSIALSQGIEDSGLFTLNFNDERYLPFENTGAVSAWTLEMPLETNRFDFSQLSDVLLTVRYTALSDGKLRQDVEQALAQAPYQGGLYVDARRQQPSVWNGFILDHHNAKIQTLPLSVSSAQFGYFKSIKIIEVLARLELADGVVLAPNASFLTLTAGTQAAVPLTFVDGVATIPQLSWPVATIDGPWLFSFDLGNATADPILTNQFVDASKLKDVQVIVLYSGTVF